MNEIVIKWRHIGRRESWFQSPLSLDFTFITTRRLLGLCAPHMGLWGLLTSTLLNLHSSSPCWHVNSHLPLTFCSCKAAG